MSSRKDHVTRPTSRVEGKPPDLMAAFDPSPLLVHQQRTAEACVAAGQVFLKGMQDVTTRSLQLQALLTHQMWSNITRLPGTDGNAQVDQTPTGAFEETIQAARGVLDAACRCPMDAFVTFQERIESATAPQNRQHPASRSKREE